MQPVRDNSRCTGWLIVVALCLGLGACRLQVIVPGGGTVVSGSGLECGESQACNLNIKDPAYSETFTAIPAGAAQFAGWKKAPRYLCGGSAEPCVVSAGALADNPLIQALVASEDQFFLEPVFRPKDVLLYIDRREGRLYRSDRNGSTTLLSQARLQWLATGIHAAPTGHRIVVSYDHVSDGRQLFLLYNPFTREVENTLQSTGAGEELAVRGWMPDGGGPLLTRFTAANSQLEVLIWEGEEPELLHREIAVPGGTRQPYLDFNFSPGGRFLALAISGLTNNGYFVGGGKLLVYALSGRRLRYETQALDSEFYQPRWAPTAARVFFQPLRASGQLSAEGVTVYASGDGQVYDVDRERLYTALAFDESSSPLLYRRWLDGDSLLFTAAADSNASPWQVRHFQGELVMSRPSLGPVVASPGGDALAYLDPERQVAIADPARGAVRRVGRAHWDDAPEDFYAYGPDFRWSQDGRYLAWDNFSGEPGQDAAGEHALYVHDRKERESRRLTRSLSAFVALGSGEVQWVAPVPALRYEEESGDGAVQSYLYRTRARASLALPTDPDCPVDYEQSPELWAADDFGWLNRCDRLAEVALEGGEFVQRPLLDGRLQQLFPALSGEYVALLTTSGLYLARQRGGELELVGQLAGGSEQDFAVHMLH